MADQKIDLGGLEADHLELEIEIQLRQVLEFEREEVLVPARELGELVVRDDEGPDLLLGKMVEADRRNCRHAQLLGGAESSVAGDDGVGRVDQERAREPKLPYRVSDLADLLRRVGSRVPPTGRQAPDRAVLDAEVAELRQPRSRGL